MPKSIREISFLACLLIVGLRVAIGWQFLYEGIWKLNSQKGSRPWTAEPYLANARGPFRDTFRDMVPDVDGLERLDYDKMVENWDGWYARFQAHHPDLDDVQKQKIELLLNGPKEFVEPLAALPVGGSDALAADCRAAAARVVAEVGGQLLSVHESGGECVIVVLVPGNGSERPRKVTMRVAE